MGGQECSEGQKVIKTNSTEMNLLGGEFFDLSCLTGLPE